MVATDAAHASLLFAIDDPEASVQPLEDFLQSCVLVGPNSQKLHMRQGMSPAKERLPKKVEFK